LRGPGRYSRARPEKWVETVHADRRGQCDLSHGRNVQVGYGPKRQPAPVELMAEIPAKVDLTAQCPPVYDQGDLGSCTANAIAAAVQFERKKQRLNPDFVPSRLFIYDGERVIEGTVGSDSGAQTRDGIKVVANPGDCPETDWPYDIGKFTRPPPPIA
jgi:C1A family cysteine protease